MSQSGPSGITGSVSVAADIFQLHRQPGPSEDPSCSTCAPATAPFCLNRCPVRFFFIRGGLPAWWMREERARAHLQIQSPSASAAYLILRVLRDAPPPFDPLRNALVTAMSSPRPETERRRTTEKRGEGAASQV